MSDDEDGEDGGEEEADEAAQDGGDKGVEETKGGEGQVDVSVFFCSGVRCVGGPPPPPPTTIVLVCPLMRAAVSAWKRAGLPKAAAAAVAAAAVETATDARSTKLSPHLVKRDVV